MSKKLTTEEFIQRAKEIHGDKYDYSKVEYINAHEKICIICPIHGEFWQKPNNHINGYGCSKCKYEDRCLTTENFIEKAKQIHGNKYDYSKVNYINAKTKVCIICPIHGEFWQTPSNHLSGFGCIYCGRTYKHSTEEFILNARKIHGNKYDYSKVNYITNNTKVCIICLEHGEFWQNPSDHLSGKGCPKCNQSHGERDVSIFLTNNNILFKEQVKLNCPLNIRKSGYIYLDFVGKYKNIPYIIEYNGQQHYEYVPYFHKGGIVQFHEQQNRDNYVKSLCEKTNTKYLEIRYDENTLDVLNNFFNSF